MQLNEDQSRALIKFRKWYRDFHNPNKCTRQWFEISGAAGTGKTTLAKHLFKRVGIKTDNILFLAYVGKAAMALSKTGVPAKTIHSAIYELKQVPYVESIDEDGYEVVKTRFEFVKRPFIGEYVEGIVVDEGSMVPGNIAEDLLSFGLPMIVLGDLNQLPPVMGSAVFLKEPDVILTKIMRQSKDSPIIRLSQDILNNVPIRAGNYGGSELVNILEDRPGLEVDFTSYDSIIVGKNQTRDMFNKYIRENVYHRTGDLKIGDKLICRKNNWSLQNELGVPLTNGLVGTVSDIYVESSTKNCYCIQFQPDDWHGKFEDLMVDRKMLNSPIDGEARRKLNNLDKLMKRSNYEQFEYAYAITCHLAQGSQYNNVLIKYEQMHSRDYCKRWLYTAVTRAIERVTLVI